MDASVETKRIFTKIGEHFIKVKFLLYLKQIQYSHKNKKKFGQIFSECSEMKSVRLNAN